MYRNFFFFQIRESIKKSMVPAKPWTQEILTRVTSVKTPTHQFCNSCQVSLCNICVKKHKDEFKSLSHEIVNFEERKSQVVFLGCKDHPGQRCESHCINCKKPVCFKCILSGPHKVEELMETFERRR